MANILQPYEIDAINYAMSGVLARAGIAVQRTSWVFTDLLNLDDNSSGSASLTGSAAATSAVAAFIDNSTTQTSGKILSIRTGGSEKAYFDYTGALYLSNVYSDTGTFSTTATNTAVHLQGAVTNGASAIGVKISNTASLANATAKIASFYSDAEVTERLYVRSDGALASATGGVLTLLSGVGAVAGPATTFNTSGATSGNAVYQFQVASVNVLRIGADGTIRDASSFSMGGGYVNVTGLANYSDGIARLNTVQAGATTLVGNTAAGAGPDLILGSTSAMTGTLVSIRNANVEKASFAADGGLIITGVASSGAGIEVPSGARIWLDAGHTTGITINSGRVFCLGSGLNTQNNLIVGTTATIGTTITHQATAMTITSGSGTPEGSVTAPIGSIYLNTAGGASTTLYVKTTGAGNTGWTAK